MNPVLMPLAVSLCFYGLAGTASLCASESRIGHLVIIGGGERPARVMQKFVELAGGAEKARLVIVPFASEDATETGRRAVEEFKALGLTRVTVLPTDPEAAVQTVGSATGVYMTGGDQVRLVMALEGTRVVKELHKLWHRGGVIGGTSAGAAVMSKRMITGEQHGIESEAEKFRSIQRDEFSTTNGFGFLTNAIVDQHFIARKRQNRLFSVILEEPSLLGLGIDEATAAIVGTDLKFEVLGERSVMVIDARRAGVIKTDSKRHFAATDLRVHFLIEGDRFDLKRARPLTGRAGR